jgi:hypothetical protein
VALTTNATIVRVRRSPGGHDDNGDPIPSTEARTTMTDWAVAPRESENIDQRGRAGVIVGLTLLTPYDADLERTDLLEVDADLYEIEGDVGAYKSPLSGWEAGTSTALRRAQG